MLNVSSAFKTQLDNDKRNFLYRLTFTLQNDDVLLVENDDLWSGSVKFTQATSGTGSFDVGAFIIGKLNFILNNMYGTFDNYDFTLATVEYEIGLKLANNNTEYIRRGRYVVDEVDYDGYLISFECLDYAYYFEQPWTATLSFPTTAGAIIQEACTRCGITLATSSWDGYNIPVNAKPQDKNMTWLAAIGYAAQICGQYAKMDNLGRLVIGWYDIDNLSQVTVDGAILDSTDAKILDHVDDPIIGSLLSATDDAWNALPASKKSKYARLNHISSVKVGHYPILITGVKCTVRNGDNDVEYVTGTNEYVIDVTGNPFIGNGNVNTVITRIAENTVGHYFYTFEASYLSRPYYDAGDLAWVEDYRNGRVYCSFITNMTFSSGQYQESSCGAETPAKKQTATYSPAMKILAEAGRANRESLDSYEAIAKSMTELISLGYGMHFSEEKQPDGSSIFYLHDGATLEESSSVWKLTSNGLVVSKDGGTTWAIDENGNALYNVLTARGINADWINSGKISIKDGNGNTTFEADTATGNVVINATSFTLTGKTINNIVQDTVNGMDLNNVVMELDNSYQLIPTDADGNYTAFPQCSSTAKIFYGASDVTASAAFATPTVSGVIGTWNASTKTYTVTGLTADSGTVTFTAIYGSVTLSKQFTVVKSKQGEDGDSVSITSTSVMYKVSTSATTIPTGTWSNDIVSANGQYLWTRTVVSYSDGTSTTSYSVSRQGIDGTNGTNGTNGRDGTNGTSNFVHIKYSPVANPSDSDITETPDEYIGICVDMNATDPTTASSYTWTKFRGSDGAQGIPGTNGTNGTNGQDGVSSYVHFAYATSADGSQNFSTTQFAGATYLGVLTDSTLADSTVYSDYAWSLIKGADGRDGADGTSVTILGSYNTLSQLHAAHPTGSAGDAYIINGDLYVWASNAWTNVGQIQGPAGRDGTDGTDGASAYVHFAYSTSSNGQQNFSVTPFDGATYIGVRSDTTQADSTVYSDYTWSLMKGADGTSVTITSTEVRYKAGTSATTAPTGTWSSTIPSVAGGSYLWTRTIVNYSDGTRTTSYSVARQGINGTNGTNGINGTDGRDGTSNYVHIKYSAVANPSDAQMTENPSDYIGICVDTNAADPSTASSYTWSRWTGEDGSNGINGTNGTDGTSAYVHFAYASSADGQTGFSTSYFSGAAYIGVRSDSTQADSTNYQDYTWSKMRGDDGTSVTITSTSVRYQSGTSATTAPTGTWQSIIPSVAGGNYLWTRTIVNYSDGTSTTSYSVARQGINGTNGTNGINGTNGTNGTSSYVHIKYSAVANPTSDQMTETPSDYIGLCIDNNEEDPTSSGAYTWTRWTGVDGTNGINGTNGTDGTPAYVHFAYAKSADGSQNFSNVYFDGAVYIGVRSDASAADSTNYRDYTWSKMRGDDGRGVVSITEYYGTSNSTSTQPSSWSTSVVNPTASNRYLWNYNTTSYTSGNPSSTDPRIIGMYSADGASGRGISSITEYYQVSSSSTTAPTSWSTSMVNTTTTNKYLWNYEKITYTDGSESSSTPRIIGTHGATGTSARTYLLEVSPKSTKLTQANNYSPNQITIRSYYRDGTSTSKTAYSSTYKIDVCVGNTWYENVCSIGSRTVAVLELRYDAQASEPYEYDGAPSIEDTFDICAILVSGASSVRVRMMNGTTLLDQEEVALLVDASSVVLDQESVFLALTNGGHDQGIYLAQDPTDGETKVYINSSYIATGELVVGGYDNGNGTITLKDASNFPFGIINNSGILLKEKSDFSNSIYYGCDIKPYGLDFYRGNNNYGGLKVLEIDVQSSSSMDFVYDHMGVLLQSQEVQIRAQDGRDLILGFYDWHNSPLDKFVLKVNRANFNVPVYASQLHASNGDSGTVVIGNTTLYITDGIITAIMES